MGIPADLAPEIVAQLGPRQGWTLYLGPLPLARALHDALGGDLLLVNGRLKPSKLAKQASGMVVLRAAPLQLPLAHDQLSTLVVADESTRLPQDLLERVCAWRRWLEPDGLLVLLARLRRSLGGVLARQRLTEPEDLTGAMLNAGFSGIGQRFYTSGLVLTQGRRLVLPGEPLPGEAPRPAQPGPPLL
jgi:hypothetical protein